jgi:hypothetical protein
LIDSHSRNFPRVCDTFAVIDTFIEQTRATGKSATDWQDLIFLGDEGSKIGDPAPAAPVFQTVSLPSGAFIGIFDEFKQLVDDIKHAENYTEAIGKDLMIVGEEGEELNLNNLGASLKHIQPEAGYKIRLEASLQAMSAMRVEYWAKVASIPQVDKFTKFPAVMTIYPKTTGEPETGYLRVFLLKDNEIVGQPSPDYPVTVF